MSAFATVLRAGNVKPKAQRQLFELSAFKKHLLFKVYIMQTASFVAGLFAGLAFPALFALSKAGTEYLSYTDTLQEEVATATIPPSV